MPSKLFLGNIFRSLIEYRFQCSFGNRIMVWNYQCLCRANNFSLDLEVAATLTMDRKTKQGKDFHYALSR